MKTDILKMLMILLIGASCSWASRPTWTGDGHYTFTDADPYFHEGIIKNTATLDILSGDFYDLYCFDNSTVNMTGGNGWVVSLSDYSNLNISGGNLNSLYTNISVNSNPKINFYVLDYEFNPSIYLDEVQIAGHWGNGSDFDIIVPESSRPYITMNIIPEPGTAALLVFGVFFLRRKRFS